MKHNLIIGLGVFPDVDIAQVEECAAFQMFGEDWFVYEEQPGRYNAAHVIGIQVSTGPATSIAEAVRAAKKIIRRQGKEKSEIAVCRWRSAIAAHMPNGRAHLNAVKYSTSF